ncbi:MAG: CvpA family protein [Flavobacteriales bacterium]|nr:CvpA family protein [Flavobacteriia bacterium]NCP04813.1 CvpA family protein [Flavobacteriales bacterium]PIV94258.1 MAG: colicin V production protein [Flavobacteriaceae bacterium CG17_big_fil_post_rev_8_21_14_2_50_33_15]PIY11929.1 MAG: colicin V production protein [Flavobacteriaceae bacterium CG_4_10_14_3_um_filter_33_47]PJB16251.1 MAG: colicin V production protein [Flavobacteriaceae bacterium CG_4_9_14_3_um_filter_33_16]
MSILDIVLLTLLVLGLIRGFMRGFFVELASLIALIAGVYGAFHFSNYAASFLKDRVDWDENTVNIAAFIITFVIIIIVIGLVGKALTKIADFAMLGLINKLLGALFGGLKVAFILSVVLIVLDKMQANIPFVQAVDQQESVLYMPLKSLVPTLFPNIKVNGKPIGEAYQEEHETAKN